MNDGKAEAPVELPRTFVADIHVTTKGAIRRCRFLLVRQMRTDSLALISG